MANENRGVTPEQRQQRHEARTRQTFFVFLRDLCNASRLPEEEAVRAAASVLTHLEERLTREEAQDLEAQLPIKIVEILNVAGDQVKDTLHKLHRDDFVACVASDLGKSNEEAESIIRAVFATVRAHISEGEANDVAAQLPKDLEALWSRSI